LEKESRKTLRVFAVASFLNDFGSDIIYPIWPLFVTSFLGANMVVLGFIDGLGEALVSISQAVSGYISDRLRKKKVFIWVGYLFGASSRIGYALSKSWAWLIPFKILDRTGKMRGSPRDAMVADLSTEENRGANFGFLRSVDNLGAVCGITTSLLFLGMLGYRNLFLLASIPSVIGALLILVFIKEAKTKGIYKGLSLRDLDRNFRLFLFLSTIFSLASFSYSFLLVFTRKWGLPETTVPVFYLVFTVAASLASYPLGRASDRFGRRAILSLSYLLFGAMCVGFIFVNSIVVFVLLFIVYGVHKAGLETVQKAFVSELCPARFRASTLGAFQMIVGLAAFPASLIAGALWENVAASAPFVFSAVLSVTALLMLPFVREGCYG
jgi:MFS family permease